MRGEGVLDHRGERIDVDLQPDGQRCLRAHAPANATELRSLDRLVELEGIAPEGFVAKGIEAEGAATLGNHLATVLIVERIGVRESVFGQEGNR